MNLFKCKACEAHKAHIKTLEAQIAYFQKQAEPAPTMFEFTDMEMPTLQPVFLPSDELPNTPVISADALLTGEF